MNNKNVIPFSQSNEKQFDEKDLIKEYDLNNYAEKFLNRENSKNAYNITMLIVVALGILVFSALLNITMKVYELNKYCGYFTALLSLVIYIFLYIIPTRKILSMKSFDLDISNSNLKKAKKYNKALRRQLGKNFIDYYENVGNENKVTLEKINAIDDALNYKDDDKLKKALSSLYDTDIKKIANKIISENALRSGLYSAISQTALIDSTMVLFINLQMMKDIIFLYGFRPTYTNLLKIYKTVLINSLLAYGMNNIKIGGLIGGMAKGIPILGSIITPLVDSTVQGLSNATLTAVMGYNTIKVLAKEYHLQNILDDINIEETDKDLEKTCNELKNELKKTQQTVKIRNA